MGALQKLWGDRSIAHKLAALVAVAIVSIAAVAYAGIMAAHQSSSQTEQIAAPQRADPRDAGIGHGPRRRP